MLASTQDHPVDRILVHTQKACGSADPNPLRSVVDDLLNHLRREMQTEKCAALCGRKALAAGAAVKQIAAFVLAIFGANRYVALTSQAIILALFVGTETLFNLAHRLPPEKKCIRLRQP